VVLCLISICKSEGYGLHKILNIASTISISNSKDSVMKKWLLILPVLLLIAIAGIYLIIPSRVSVTQSVAVTATQEGTLRFLSSLPKWKKFWPGTSGENRDSTRFYSYGGYNFFLKTVLYNAIELNAERNKDSVPTALYILPYQLDSFKLQWTALLPSTNNPFKRIQNYIKAKQLSSILKIILDTMGASLSKVETIYGIDIKKEKVPFQHFITTKKLLVQDPSTETIYTMVEELKGYAAKEGAHQTDQPIFNVHPTEESQYTLQVAIPIDKDIPDNDLFSHKWMMKGGNILTAEVKGGLREIEKAKAQVNEYIIDYRRSVIAIPFQMLLTDRRAEPDSAKWITRLYFPVI